MDDDTATGDQREVIITCEPVELYKVLKFEGLARSGGEAKSLIDDGAVDVNGRVERRRRRKLVDGDTVAFGGETLRLRHEARAPSSRADTHTPTERT